MPSSNSETTIARQWELLRNHLPARQPGKSSRQFRELLASAGHNVSKRTVERDLTELSRIFPIARNERSIPHGWHWSENARIDAAMSDFMTKRRPPVEIRDKLDLAYRIEGQSVVIFSIRPFWRDHSETTEEPAAKATYVRKTDRWKIYWQRSDMKWHTYPPHPEAIFFDEFLAIVDEDEHGCFWG